MDASFSSPSGLQQVIDDLRARSDELPAAHAGLREHMLTPLALANDITRLESWLDTQAIAADGMDRKSQAAYMIGGLAWAVCTWMAAFALTGNRAVRRVAFAQERYWWGEGTPDAHEYVRYPISIEVGDGPANHRETIEQIFEPIIAATMVNSGLSAGAQWRIVADDVASAFLYGGKALGMGERGMAMASDILAEGRLNNGKTGFVEITAGKACEWFLVRGGCCRYYTTSGGEYCTSCVLRKRDDQVARYTAYLASLQTLE
jgi:hypothetical protein